MIRGRSCSPCSTPVPGTDTRDTGRIFVRRGGEGKVTDTVAVFSWSECPCPYVWILGGGRILPDWTYFSGVWVTQGPSSSGLNWKNQEECDNHHITNSHQGLRKPLAPLSPRFRTRKRKCFVPSSHPSRDWYLCVKVPHCLLRGQRKTGIFPRIR